MKNYVVEWIKAAGIRAIRTVAQTALGMFTVGMVLSEVDWLNVVSASVVAGIYSLLTSIAGLPEVDKTEGSIEDEIE